MTEGDHRDQRGRYRDPYEPVRTDPIIHFSGADGALGGLVLWGLIVSVLPFPCTFDHILYLAGRLGRMFG